MWATLLFVCVQSLDSSRVQFLQRHSLVRREIQASLVANETEAYNASKPIDWATFVGDYCAEFCLMKGVDAGHCTVCEQRINFTVSEGKVSCDVECQGIQTDKVTEETVDCAHRLDKCMLVDLDAATCKLECATASGKDAAKCASECGAFKASKRLEGTLFSTYFGPNEVPSVVEQEVNGTNGTMEMQNVTVYTVEGVEPLPTVGPGDRIDPVKADYRFHVNESSWLAEPQAYCGSYYCNAAEVGVAGVDPYHCIECVNRLNNSVEHGLMHCRAGCDMKTTDNIHKEVQCEESCLWSEFDTGTCYLECALPMNKAVENCMGECEKSKAEKRAAGEEVRPFGWPAPPSNSSNASNASNATSSE